MEGAKQRDDGSIKLMKPSLGDSGHFICRSFAGREVHHYVSVVYQPDPLTAVHTLYFKMKENCSTISKQLDELLKEVQNKVLCKGSEKCLYTLKRSCEDKSPAYGGFRFRLLLQLSLNIPVTSKAELLPLIEHTKMDDLADVRREAPLLLALGGNETLVHDFVLSFLERKRLAKMVLVDEDKIELRKPNPTFDGNCKYGGSRLLDMMCAPCPNGHYSVKKSPNEMTSSLCQACAVMSAQAYFGATDCKTKPTKVPILQPPSTAPPPSTPSPYIVMGIDMEPVAAMTVPELGGVVIAAIFVFGLLGYLLVTLVKSMLRKKRKKGQTKSLPSYHSLRDESDEEMGSILSVRSYNSMASNKP